MSQERPSQSQRQRDEKDEKHAEKEEKSWDEKWRRDPLSSAVWALVIIWAGLVLLAVNFGLFEDSFLEGWPFFFLGAGVLLLLELIFRLLVPAHRQPLAGNFIVAMIFLAIGLGGLISWNLIWAVALIAIGAYVLLRGLLGRRQL
jgi:hypothetical protein